MVNLPRLALRTLGKRLPTAAGTIRTDTDGPVSIRRDRFGIPHIRAEHPADAWFGVGFCHGQDRTFQLEVVLRLVRGTLSELVGKDALPIDELSRRIGFRRYGEALLGEIAEEHRALATAYAAGVRAGATDGLKRRPHEFVLLRSRPTAYEPADALALLAVQAFTLASNWDSELTRLAIVQADGPDAAAALEPTYPGWLPASQTPGADGADTGDLPGLVAADLRRLAEATGWFGGGSNNWAISGDHTKTGRPILANDPHLAPVLPAHWYLVDVACPDWRLVGATLAGTPAVPIGHNGKAAWGVTAGLADTTDLFIEELGDDGLSVRRGEEFVPLSARVERIEIRGAEDVEITCLETDHGPIIGPALEGTPHAISMAATWLRPDAIAGFFSVGQIASFEELRSAFASWPSVSLNVAFANEDGEIGWQLIGDLPVRKSGIGAIPLPAADPDVGWEDHTIATSALPHLVDPATGFVVTANNLPAGGAPHLGVDFIDGYRAARIAELITERSDWDVDAVLRSQMDQASIPWREMREPILDALEPAGDLAMLFDVLRTWDGVVGPRSAGATAFSTVTSELVAMVARAKAPNASDRALGRGFTPLVPMTMSRVRRIGHLSHLIRTRPPGWFPDGWDEAIRTAARAALARIVERAGRNPESWEWGSLRQLVLKHPLGLRPPLDKVYNRGPLPHGGDGNTVNPAPVDPLDPFSNPDFAIASLRMVVDLGDWEKARFVLAGGQSGNPFSPHYDDQLRIWARGDAIAIAWDEADIERTARDELLLQPR